MTNKEYYYEKFNPEESDELCAAQFGTAIAQAMVEFSAENNSKPGKSYSQWYLEWTEWLRAERKKKD